MTATPPSVPPDNILSKSPSWWQVILAAIGLAIVLVSRFGDAEERLRVVEYQEQISIGDRSGIKVDVATLKNDYQSEMRVVSDKLTRVETLLQEMRQHQR